MTEIGGTVVVVSADPPPGTGASVLNRQPEPGGLKVAMLMIGDGRFVNMGDDGCVGVVVGESVGTLVVGAASVVVAVVGWVVVPAVEGEW